MKYSCTCSKDGESVVLCRSVWCVCAPMTSTCEDCSLLFVFRALPADGDRRRWCFDCALVHPGACVFNDVDANSDVKQLRDMWVALVTAAATRQQRSAANLKVYVRARYIERHFSLLGGALGIVEFLMGGRDVREGKLKQVWLSLPCCPCCYHYCCLYFYLGC